MKEIYLVDGSSLAYRTFFAFIRNPLINSKGENTSAVYGFTNTILKLLKEYRPEYLCVAFDLPKPTFRHHLFAEYKAKRPKAPDELKPQIPKIKEILKNLGIKIVEVEGFEADDVISTLAIKAKENGFKVVIFAGDKDFLQLVDDKIRILNPRTFEWDTPEKRLGVKSHQIADFLALCGDQIDNVPGIPGIGEKTAKKLLEEFGNIDNIYQNIHKVYPESIKMALMRNKERCLKSRELVKLRTDVPVEFEPEEFKIGKPNFQRLIEIFKDLEFFSIIERMGLKEEIKFKKLQNVSEIIPKIKDKISVFVYDDKYYSVAISDKDVYVIQGNFKNLHSVIEDEKVEKIVLSAKPLHKEFNVKGKIFDLEVAAYLLKPGIRELSFDWISLEFLKLPLRKIGKDDFYECLAERAYAGWRLREPLENELKEKELLKLYYEVELPLTKVLAKMEKTGILIDVEFFKEEQRKIIQKLREIEEEIYKMAGVRFNINSPSQLSNVLFNRLKLKPIKKTKTGYSTDQEVLEKLAEIHPLPRKLLEYRELFKLKSTYVDVMLNLRNPRTGRVHATWNQTVTATGRLSASNPNLQTLPHLEIKKGFIAPEGYSLISADYSQIELRILASVSGDENLRKAFERGEDIHTKTACAIFGIKPEEVTHDHRRKAKVVNFGIVYGMSAYGLSQELGIDVHDAHKFITKYFETYPGVKKWIENTLSFARQNGYVRTLLGRRRYVEGINSKNARVRQFEERVAINMPIQGTAADMIKIAMINIDKRFEKESPKSKIILQIHDELVFEVPDEEVDKVKEIISYEMENALPLKVPVKVDIGVGKNLYEAKPD